MTNDRRATGAHPVTDPVTDAAQPPFVDADQVRDAARPLIADLLARSSLGRPGATRLRDRTPVEEAEMMRQLSELEIALAATRDGHHELDLGQVPDMWRLATLYQHLDLPGDSARCYTLIAQAALHAAAAAHNQSGDPAAADLAARRAETLQTRA